MIIISDCLKNKLDEGCIKVASSLAKKLQAKGATLIAVNCDGEYADYRINANKILSNQEIYDVIKKHNQSILYIPFASNTLGSAIRTFVLKKKSKKEVSVLFTLRWNMNGATKLLLEKSKCKIITISEESYHYYKKELPQNEVINVYTGVDTSKFAKATETKKMELRKKYAIPLDAKVILHVGHLKRGRNVDKFLELEDDFFSVLVFSSVTEQESDLRKQLEAKGNIKIIDDYISNIEEIYQLADIYLFPIVEENNSIDLPLSVLEAAGCNIKILATPYKEIAYFEKVSGFEIITSLEKTALNNSIRAMLNYGIEANTSVIAKRYDWTNAIAELMKIIE